MKQLLETSVTAELQAARRLLSTWLSIELQHCTRFLSIIRSIAHFAGRSNLQSTGFGPQGFSFCS